jgi:hypothetical protein
MMDLNGLELAIVVVWVVGIGAIVHTGPRAGFTARTWLALAAAVTVPVVGSLLAIAYAAFAASDQRTHQMAQRSEYK